MKIIMFCVVLLIGHAGFADVVIKEISTVRKMVIATDSGKNSSVKKGGEFVATFQDNTQCTMEVVRVKNGKIFLDASLCKINLLQKGQTLQVSAFDGKIGIGKKNKYSSTNLQESWYTMWNYAPLTSITSSRDIETKFKSNTTLIGADLLGFYWPLFREGLILGGVLNYYNLDNEAEDFKSSVLEVMNFNTSALYFFGGEIGRGFFVRGDLGVRSTRFEYAPKIERDYGVFAGPPVKKTDTGLNAALGVGGSMPISKEVRILFQAVYNANLGGDIDASTIQFFVGLLL